MADPTMPYDHSMRLLVEREPATLLSYLLKRPISNDEIRRVPAELSGPSVRLDTVFLNSATRHASFIWSSRSTPAPTVFTPGS